MNDTILTILTLATFIVIVIGVISYTVMTGRIIKGLEIENKKLKKRIAFLEDCNKNTETLQIVKNGEEFTDNTDVKFGEF